jgi:DUF3043 family protein
VNLLGRKKDNPQAQGSDSADEGGTVVRQGTSTAPKGRPTPKRNETVRKRGPVAPAPMTMAEARKRRKELGGPKLSKEERRAEKVSRRADMADRREKMMSGEDAYLLPRDKGPVKRYVRDIVDARRNLLGLFMPAALGLVFVMVSVPSPQFQRLISPAMLVLVLIMLVDAVVIGRRVTKLVDEKYPDHTESGWKLGIYAASRASQLRRMRAPRPQVDRGAKIG